MAVVRDILGALERLAPCRHALTFDKVGLQIGDPDAEVRRVVVSLDRTPSAVEYARASGAQMLVSHHPLIFSPLSTVTTGTLEGRTVLLLAKYDIAFAAAHTNWDAAVGGINDTLAKLIGLQNIRWFGEAAQIDNLKLVFFCPLKDLDAVIDAVSIAGAGVIGEYSRCAFYSQGNGTFVAGLNANPTMGRPGQKETVDEVRVEMVLPSEKVREVRQALLTTHPYEEPAYDFMALAPVEGMPLGRIGELTTKTTLREFVRLVDQRLGTRSLAWGDPDKLIGTVAVVGGAADGEWRNARASGADLLLTGEVKQHIAVEVGENNFAILSSGHYATEHPGSAELARALQDCLPEIHFLVYEPSPGMAGRPL